MGYVSTKTSSVSSFSSPKSSSYESSKVSSISPKSSSYESSKVSEPIPMHRVVRRNFGNDIPQQSAKTNLNDFRDLLTRYLELSEKIDEATANLAQLEADRRILEEKIANNPEYEKFASLFNSMKGPRK